jgi:hypothetical protein
MPGLAEELTGPDSIGPWAANVFCVTTTRHLFNPAGDPGLAVVACLRCNLGANCVSRLGASDVVPRDLLRGDEKAPPIGHNSAAASVPDPCGADLNAVILGCAIVGGYADFVAP